MSYAPQSLTLRTRSWSIRTPVAATSTCPLPAWVQASKNPLRTATAADVPPVMMGCSGDQSSVDSAMRWISSCTSPVLPGRAGIGKVVPPRARWAADNLAHLASSACPVVETSTAESGDDQARETSCAVLLTGPFQPLKPRHTYRRVPNGSSSSSYSSNAGGMYEYVIWAS